MPKSPILPPPLYAILTATLEKMLNGLIQLDPFHHFDAFEGKVFHLILTDFVAPNDRRTGDFEQFGQFFLIFSNHQIAVQSQLQGEADATIETDLYSLQRLKQNQSLMRVTLSGDISLAEQLIDTFAQLEPDWEEALSHYVGDLLAFQISQFFQRLTTLQHKQIQALEETLKEYLQYEIELLPTASQVQHFNQEVSHLSEQTDQLEARLQRLETLLTQTNTPA